MQSQTFLDLWANTYHKRRDVILPCWCLRKMYTRQIIALMGDIAEQAGLDMNTEYYSTDATLFRPSDAHHDNGSLYIINPAVLFEHENDTNSITSEVCHQLLLEGELHVIVGYYRDEVSVEYMEYLHGIVSKSRKADKLHENRSFMIILGCDDLWLEEGYWRGYVYQKEGWDEIQPQGV